MAVILDANLQTDLRLAACLDRFLYNLLADSASIRRAGGVSYYGSVNQSGALTKRVRLAGLDGTNAMATQLAENTAVANTTLIDASADITVARGSLRYDLADGAAISGFAQDVDLAGLSTSMVAAYEGWWNSLLCASIQALGTDVGSSGVDASMDDFYDGLSVLETNSVKGPYHLLIHPRQLADLQQSIRGEAGAFQFMAPSQEMLNIKGPGYAGNLLGVEIFTSTDVASAGGNRHGAMFGPQCLGWADGIPPVPNTVQTATFADVPILVEFQRVSEEATTKVVGHGWAGTAIIQDAAGVGFVTDA